MMTNLRRQRLPGVTLISSLLFLLIVRSINADNYVLTSADHKSLMVGMGCFWCGEEAFERYAPGVIEAVSGYAGGDNDNPTYGYHPGHNEVVLVEYDPNKTSYEVLLEYAWKNLDPFNGRGQFCDRGTSYLPQVFYSTLEEKLIGERVLKKILEDYPMWNIDDLMVPILDRPKFWIAEEYHQNYYIKNPGNYLYYKNVCGRKNRLIEVWGEDVYKCYHDAESACTLGGKNTVTNTFGDEVQTEINRKGINKEGKAAFLQYKYIVIISVIGAIFVFGIVVYSFVFKPAKKKKRTHGKGK